MRIASLTISNYRSIRELKLDNLGPVNVLFGRNNVGKSNILRALHLAFYSLSNGKVYLRDTMFHNRYIYRPAEISLDLILDKDFWNREKFSSAVKKSETGIRSMLAENPILKNVEDRVKTFVANLRSFRPLHKIRLQTSFLFNEEESDMKILVKDLESDYTFDYGEFASAYRSLSNIIRGRMKEEGYRRDEQLESQLVLLGIDIEARELFELRERRKYDRQFPESRSVHLWRRLFAKIKDPHKRERAEVLFSDFMATAQIQEDDPMRLLQEGFNIVKRYFNEISNNFILIPNKEYFSKGPLSEQGGEPIEIFNVERFMDRLGLLIGSPTRKGMQLIRQFNNVFKKSFGEFGEVDVRKFRDEVLAIFDTGFTALPIENQGLGIQDLFLYVAHMILFDPAIIAIEEPEGGLSTENQKTLCNIIQKVYGGSDRQIFISSHSEEFEVSNSYVIELRKGGTKEISRVNREGEYEKKIGKVLIKRKLEEEKREYEILLREVTEKQIALDILNYIHSLNDKEKIDPERISDKLGYKKEKVQEILKKTIGRTV